MSTSTAHAFNALIERLANRTLQGKVRAVKLAITALLSGGHILLEDIPGLGKTTLALALARTLDLSFGRIQCTTDLLPSDIIGLSIYRREQNRFDFHPGPIFNHLVLVDEINRAMPKTQSALLEAMEEGRITVEGETRPLPSPFLVIATQNPVEQVGTFPLPESQLDRFNVRTGIGYPPPEVEKAIIRGGSVREQVETLQPLLKREEILEARRQVREVHLAESVAQYIFELVQATREHPAVLTGLSTRAALNLAEAAKATAFLGGRDYVAPEDVKQVAPPVCAHRLLLRPEQEHLEKEELLRLLLHELPAPRG
jgi:MoxR-like ATPase